MKMWKSNFEYLASQSFGEFIKGVFIRLIPGMILALVILYLLLGSEFVITVLARPWSGFYIVTLLYFGFNIFLWIIARMNRK